MNLKKQIEIGKAWDYFSKLTLAICLFWTFPRIFWFKFCKQGLPEQWRSNFSPSCQSSILLSFFHFVPFAAVYASLLFNRDAYFGHSAGLGIPLYISDLDLTSLEIEDDIFGSLLTTFEVINYLGAVGAVVKIVLSL